MSAASWLIVCWLGFMAGFVAGLFWRGCSILSNGSDSDLSDSNTGSETGIEEVSETFENYIKGKEDVKD